MDVQIEEVQPGWTVCTADGKEVGKVVGLDAGVLRIKHHAMLGDKEWRIPRNAVSNVEEGRVDLSLTEDELKHQQ